MPSSTYILRNGGDRRRVVKSRLFNIDNGSGTVLDDAILQVPEALTLHSAKVLYTTETTGTVAAATVSVGTTLTGVDVVAATALENAKAVGTTTALTLAKTAIPANTTLFVEHTGVATTAAGEYYVVIEYSVDNQTAI
jgi:hypothetical protein